MKLPPVAIVNFPGAGAFPLVWLALPREHTECDGATKCAPWDGLGEPLVEWVSHWRVAPIRMTLIGVEDAALVLAQPAPIKLILANADQCTEPTRLLFGCREVARDGLTFTVEFTASRHDYNELCQWWDRVSK